MQNTQSLKSPALKLPRVLEIDSQRIAIEGALTSKSSPLWKSDTPRDDILNVPHIDFSINLERALQAAMVSRQLERGLEAIEKRLESEERGLSALREKQGSQPAYRISRILIIANDGAERFNRECEKVLRRYSDRVLGIRVNASSERLAQKIFGPEKIAKALLVSDKDAVVNVLKSLVDSHK